MDQFRGEHIGLVYQKNYFIESLSVLDNLIISPYCTKKKPSKNHCQIRGTLKLNYNDPNEYYYILENAVPKK